MKLKFAKIKQCLLLVAIELLYLGQTRLHSEEGLLLRSLTKVVAQRYSVKRGVLRNFAKFTGKHLCQRLFFKKESLAQVFSCEFCEIFKNTFSSRTPPVAASALM